jgi:F0F1-type ATP synthase assembly protein I
MLHVGLSQFLITVVAAITAGIYHDVWTAFGVGFGGAIALGNTTVMYLSLRLADPALHGMTTIYAGLAVRLIWTLAAMGIGMGLFGLDPIAILAAFALAQIGYVAGGLHATSGHVAHESREQENH